MTERPRPPLVDGPLGGPSGDGTIGDPNDPADLVDVPFRALDAGVPLLLLPVRVATRYRLQADPPELRIRVYPESLHVDDSTTPASAALLPRQWIVRGYDSDGGLMFQRHGGLIDPDLRLAPASDGAPWTLHSAGLDVDEAISWMLDYERAVEAGMAVTVALTGDAEPARSGVATLAVFGVTAELDAAGAQETVTTLLDQRLATGALGFVAQGTPTNNTESARTPYPIVGTSTGGEPTATERIAAPPGGPGGPGGTTTEPLPPMLVQPDDHATRFAGALGLGPSGHWRDVPGGADLQPGRSEAMRALLFEAVLGTLVRQLLSVGETPGLAASKIALLRDWFVKRVHGGAPVPCIQIGAQPYGIVPAMRTAAADSLDLTTVSGQVERIVALLVDVWRGAVAVVPRMNPDDTDSGGDVHDSTLGAVLAGQPHPARLLMRRIEDAANVPVLFRLFTRPGYYQATLAYLDPANPDLESPDKEIAQLWALTNIGDSPPSQDTIDEQIAVWTEFRTDLPGWLDTFGKAGLAADADLYVGGILDNLTGYETRQRPARFLGLDRYEGALGEDNTNVIEAWYRSGLTEWGNDKVVTSGGVVPPADYLADLADRFARRTPALPPSTLGADFLAAPPLLYQLLDASLTLVPAGGEDEARVRRAFDEVAGADAAELDWLTRECLGLGAHRLDAWHTSVASSRLGELRAARPAGIQVGAFGWVVDLAPREIDRPSQGYVLAPSLSHAATAAILRAGWLAHGNDDALSIAALDVSSARVRSATWLLDGVRTGQSLGQLLGYQYERLLHDAFADEQIRAVRQAVLDATGRPDVAPDQPVDGIELLDLWRAGSLGTLSGTAVGALDALEQTFDAVNDVGTFEAVHQLTGGNSDRAAAMLDTLALGTSRPPELRALATPRSGVAIEHRLVAVGPSGPAGSGLADDAGWVLGERGTVLPTIEAWVRSLLPAAGAVGFAARSIGTDGTAGEWGPTTLAGLGLSALDAVLLCGTDPTGAGEALGTLVAAALDPARPAEVDPSSPGPVAVSLAEFSVLAAEITAVIGAARPLTPNDVRAGAQAGDEVADTSTVVAAATALLAQLDGIADRLDDAIEAGDATEITAQVTRLARLGVSAGGAPADVESARAAHERFGQRLAAVVAIDVDRDDPLPGTADRLAAAIGHRLPMAGTVSLSAEATIRPDPGLAAPFDIAAWLDAASRVRADAGRLASAGTLSTLLSPTGGLRLSAGQTPRLTGEGWAATGRPPERTGGRTSIVFASDGRPVDDDVCGLVVDTWSDTIPNATEVAGLALHYDAPSSSAPQACILAVVPPGTEQWTLDLVAETLTEVAEWTTLRAVGPEDLGDDGQIIPSIFVPGTLTMADGSAVPA